MAWLFGIGNSSNYQRPGMDVFIEFADAFAVYFAAAGEIQHGQDFVVFGRKQIHDCDLF